MIAYGNSWESRENPLCAEFRHQFQEYLDGRLDRNRSLLMEDHLSRCPNCRAELAIHKGERKAAVVPIRRLSAGRDGASGQPQRPLILAALSMSGAPN